MCLVVKETAIHTLGRADNKPLLSQRGRVLREKGQAGRKRLSRLQGRAAGQGASADPLSGALRAVRGVF